jgi:predicted secreted hydrolase
MRTEWWYVTGWLATPDGKPLGFQLTFFRSATASDRANPSAFAPAQLIIGHAALSDPALGKLVHDQRTARTGFDLAGARTGDTDVWIDDWHLSRTDVSGASQYRAALPGTRLGLDLTFSTTQPLLLHGDAGFSQKGPLPRQASYYYTQPHLAVSGRVVHQGSAREVKGQAWLDHEWSSEILAAGATGWDWIGINLDDGGALMAFRVRDRDGRTMWAGGSWRSAAGRTRTFDARSVGFSQVRTWRSARTGTTYPVAMRVELGDAAAREVIELTPLFDDQELDARSSTGIVYWEGAVRATLDGRPIGRGYLELTGYHSALAL